MARTDRKQLAEALNQIIQKSSDQKKLAKAIARYVSENHLTKDLDAILREVENIRRADGIVEATVVSANSLNEKLKRDIRSLLTQEQQSKKVIINQVIDADVLGGLRIITGEQQLDVTVQSKLNRLKRAVV
jgi:F0F1-type ATP synthase delta subunit